ncbi:2-amino-4-hydroxy-6-hydroxymethyldihydropteridine diphosphokinase [Pseudoalteromonas fenneropenaei]|uniref:2-amino-4-hydroxy-6-hydroxymethyldihydropteridine diphosphokinase n=1 Tax=Pseudoalteromonas fenneropenaei TaxID=1737459 RepID=A0ABV7CNT9_9GAMM
MADIYISIGSNVEREKHFRAGLASLIAYFPKYRHSSVFESEAVGFKGRNFYNSVFYANTELSLAETCALLKELEKQHGRKASDKKFSPRTLDLDLLLYDTVICDTPAQLPRGEICTNAFVLQPLAELAPHLPHPCQGKTMAELWQAYDKSQQKLWKVEFSLL